MTIEKNLINLGLSISSAPSAVANYLGYQVSNNIVIVSGQLPFKDGVLKFRGKVGVEITLEQAQEAAKLCAINILSQLKAACDGDLEKVSRCLRLGGFVNCTADYTDHPKVINGASDLIVEVFGKAGKHARAAVGVNTLPLGSSVEIEAMFELKS